MIQNTIRILTCLLFLQGAFAQSIKLPNWNSASDQCPASFFFQPLEGWSMLGEDGALFISLELPRGETNTQHGKHGFVTYLMGTHWSVRGNDRFNLHFQPLANTFEFVANGGGNKLELRTEPLPTDHGLVAEAAVLVVLQREGDTFSLRAVSGRDGTIYHSEAVEVPDYVLSDVRGGSGFAVGTVADTPATPERDRGKGHQGNLEFVGYTTRTVSDAAIRRIALGVDPVAELGEETLRWYRHFDGAERMEQLAPTTPADNTPPSLVVGGGFMVDGATIRRQSPDTYLTLDYLPDGYVWGLDLAQPESQTVALSGTVDGLSGGSIIEVRVLAADGREVVMDWTPLATIEGDSTVWRGSFQMPRSHGWNFIEVRSADLPELVFRSRSRCAVGYKIAMIGQSEMSYFLRGYGGGMNWRPEDGAYSMVTSATENPNNTAHAHDRPQIFLAEPWDKISDGVLATVRQLREYTDTPICIVSLTKSGTGATELADDDRNEKRRWQDLDAKVRLSGRDFSMMVWMWHASDRGYGLRYGEGIFDPIVLGLVSEPKHERYEHFIYDGTFDPQMVFCPMLHWGLGCQRQALEGEQPIAKNRGLGSTMECMLSQKQWREANADGNPKAPFLRPVPQDDFPTANDIQGDRYHAGHSDTNSPPRRSPHRVPHGRIPGEGAGFQRVAESADGGGPVRRGPIRTPGAVFPAQRRDIAYRGR